MAEKPTSHTGPLRAWFRRVATRSIIWGGEHLLALLDDEFAFGIPLVDSLPEEDESARADRVRAALALIRDVDPHRFARLRRDVRRIFIAPIVGAQYDPRNRSIMLTDPLRMSVAAVAGTLVHEATHARIDGCGIRYEPELRERIESICVHAEVDFLRRAPGEEAEADTQLAALRGEPWYTNERIESRRRRNMEALHVPEWLWKVLRFLTGD
jgi:hypothetical protein